MKQFITLALLISVLLVSCSEQEEDLQLNLQNACTAENPLELEWMQDLVAELECGKYSCRVSILKSNYNGESVFYVQMTDPLCNGVNEIDLYNCVGEKIEEFTLEESGEFIDDHWNEAEEIFSCNE